MAAIRGPKFQYMGILAGQHGGCIVNWLIDLPQAHSDLDIDPYVLVNLQYITQYLETLTLLK